MKRDGRETEAWGSRQRALSPPSSPSCGFSSPQHSRSLPRGGFAWPRPCSEARGRPRRCSTRHRPVPCWSGAMERSKSTADWSAISVCPVSPAASRDLAGETNGILRDDLERLAAAIDAARLSAGRIALKVRASGSGRVFEVRGGPAPAPEPAGTVLLWLLDTSAGEEERAGHGGAAAADRSRAGFARAPDRGRAVPDVVPRPRPSPRARQPCASSKRSKARMPPK